MKVSQQIVRIGLAYLLLAVMLSVCRGQESVAASSKKPPLVVASFFPLYDFARQVGGPDFEVKCLVPVGADPHEVEATPAAARQVANADLVLLLGLGMDGWVEKLATAEHKAHVVHLGEGLPTHTMGKALLSELADASTHVNPEEIDPHVWLDPVLAQQMVKRIATAMTEIAPDHRGDIEARRDAYLGELQKLDQEYKAATAHLKQKEVVTFHGAFAYLFSRYGLKTAGVIEEFPGKEPSAAYLRTLVDTMRQLHQHVIFAEPELSDRAAKIIAQEVGGRVEKLDPCETILSENPNATYLERQHRNIQVLRNALGGATP
jgi:zinc transport system substrate-binding protein